MLCYGRKASQTSNLAIGLHLFSPVFLQGGENPCSIINVLKKMKSRKQLVICKMGVNLGAFTDPTIVPNDCSKKHSDLRLYHMESIHLHLLLYGGGCISFN